MNQRLKSSFAQQVPVRQLHKFPIFTTFVALLGGIVLGNNMMLAANAITYGQDEMPVSLSGDEFIVVRDTALSDPRVEELIDGKNYSITDCCGFYKDPTTSSWQPVINIRVANELQIAIRVDVDAKKVTGIETGPAIQFQVPRSDSTAADDVVKQSSNDGTTSIPMFATNTSAMLPAILVIGIVLGGAAGAVFYYVKKGKNHLATEEKK